MIYFISQEHVNLNEDSMNTIDDTGTQSKQKNLLHQARGLSHPISLSGHQMISTEQINSSRRGIPPIGKARKVEAIGTVRKVRKIATAWKIETARKVEATRKIEAAWQVEAAW